MTGREWNPGDVAMWYGPNGPERVFRVLDYVNDGDPEWQTTASGHGYPRQADLRPLVVIDPENRRAVEQLRDMYDAAYAAQTGHRLLAAQRGDRGNALQASLRELANPNPPKPEEPTGKYAEVEDHRGWLYYRDPLGEWRLAQNPVTPRRWSDIDAVRVLSKGVSA